jgi:hypothetical protein
MGSEEQQEERIAAGERELFREMWAHMVCVGRERKMGGGGGGGRDGDDGMRLSLS